MVKHIFRIPGVAEPIAIGLPAFIDIGRQVSIEGDPQAMRVESTMIRMCTDPGVGGAWIEVDVQLSIVGSRQRPTR